MRKSKLAIITAPAILWAGLLVATPALATILGGPSGVGQAAKTIDPIAKVDWGWDNGDLYCNDGVRGEAEDYGYCAVCEYNKSWWESYGKSHPELWSKWKTSSAVGRVERVRRERERERVRERERERERVRERPRERERERVRERPRERERVRERPRERERVQRVGQGRTGGGRTGGGRTGGGRTGGGRTGGGSHRSDVNLKHDVTLLGHLDNGLGYYRFSYNGSDQAYVGVIAQDVQAVRPQAVVRGHDGYLWVNYDRLGLRLMTWDQWLASGEKPPTTRH
jgi:hypothetical protein